MKEANEAAASRARVDGTGTVSIKMTDNIIFKFPIIPERNDINIHCISIF